MSKTHLLTYCPILSLITSLYALLLRHRTSLLPEILIALATTMYAGHQDSRLLLTTRAGWSSAPLF